MTPPKESGADVASPRAPPVKPGVAVDRTRPPPEPVVGPKRASALRSPPPRNRSPPPRKQELHVKSLPAQKPEEPKKLEDPLGSSSAEQGVSERSTSPSKEKEDRSESKSSGRSPLVRRPKGAKQRKKFEKKGFGGERVKFADPVARVVDSGGDRSGGEEKKKKDPPGGAKAKGKGKAKQGKKGQGKGKSQKKGKWGQGKKKGNKGSQGAGWRAGGQRDR